MFTGNVLITGGAGFLGRAIMHQARVEAWPCRFIVYSRDEQKHYAARFKYPDARYVVGDVLDTGRLHLLMSTCDYVIHAAAIKYIPECEAQPSEALRVNVDGTRSVMDAARASGVKRVVVISTDKAAGPINTYGMTKALCERLVWETADLPSLACTEFVACRYGNVIGSTGSVWHVFKDQSKRDGFLSVTDPLMTRFFMPAQDAVKLIVASLDAPAGTVVLPEPSAVLMQDLADHLTEAWDLGPFKCVGRRPGEKRHEQMVADVERVRLERYHDYYVMYPPTHEEGLELSAYDGRFNSDLAPQMMPYDFAVAAIASEAI